MVKVYLELGRKRVFAGALDWPGWCRSGRDEESALQALFEAGTRYQAVLGSADGFGAPAQPSAFTVTERLQGGTTTDFGAPEAIPSEDRRPLDEPERDRLQRLLKACWRGFDAAAEEAAGRELRKGPRGGGRDLQAIIQHVTEAEGNYLGRIGWKPGMGLARETAEVLGQSREAILAALAASAAGLLPERGPRGGVLWPARYFVRRVAWHVLDHAWEIEDRRL